ncbi:glycosyltransferase, partial [Serratia marcescens]|uniref:glycosyltransferase n=2 Tax=Pseudomonadota TaxID=1224 RepID=UPI0029DAFF20
MCDRLAQSGVAPDRIVEFRNWANVLPTVSNNTLRNAWNVTTPHVALYSGNIANKQGVEIIVEAAKRLRERRDLTFIVCGNGPYRANLIAL